MKQNETWIYLEPKKTPKADLERLSPLLKSIGLTLSLSVVVLAFEVKQYNTEKEVHLVANNAVAEEIIEVPPTDIPPPPPTTVQMPQIVEVPNEERVAEEIEVTFDIEVNTDTRLQDIVISDPGPVEEVEKEKVDQIFLVVEETAVPKDGLEAFYKFAAGNIHYPAQARRMGVEGKVFVEFVVSKDGTLTDIKVVKGIGSGCDEEAVRVVSMSPPWNPAKQRGKPVRQRIILPIIFKMYKV
jgi:periplasmic protein TonB